MAFVVIGFIFYSYLYPVTEKNIESVNEKSAKDIEKKLHDEQAYLSSVSRDGDATFLIKKIKSDIENSKLLLEKTIYMNDYVDNKLKELSYLLFNDENWAKFLNTISQLAQKYSVRIKVIENKINEPSIQKIEQILTLKVSFNGSFANTMKYMNAIEESELVVDIYELNCTGQKDIEGQFNIAVWGMKY
ncbi:hypothetical protein Sdiek2_1515 [Sulfurospirillum diekertiae]|nr:hypothetical protein Sdiek2_1515 [Sulfurospirillum diekertiae]